MNEQVRIDEAAIQKPDDIIDAVWSHPKDATIVVSRVFLDRVRLWVDGAGRKFVEPHTPSHLCNHPLIVEG